MTNTEKIIGQYEETHNQKYGLFTEEMNDIREMSDGMCDIISNAFKYGYMQGRKATVADVRKAVRV
ncbi:MAG: hypothetical protein LUI12_01740 [Clostridiales bacterium]|nr:hypothetical protein [Clostridiales bacterium]